MRIKGTIYNSKKSAPHGELILFLPTFVRLFYQLIRGTGAGLVAFAVLVFSFSFGPTIQKEISYELKQDGLIKKENVSNSFELDTAKAEETIEVQKEAQSYGVTSHFSVVIPKIEAYANVIANVDTGDRDDYLDALSKGVAHAKGTYFPGQGGRIFLFSHSTDSPLNFARYNAIFYLLRKLEKGDGIIIFFADKKYVYEVIDKVVADPSDTSWLSPVKEGEELVLMTCDPPGTTWNRLLVVARPASDKDVY